MTETEALELALRFLHDESYDEVELRLAQRLDYATHKLFRSLPRPRSGYCWQLSFESAREDAEDEVTSIGWFYVVVDEATKRVMGNDDFMAFLLAGDVS